MLKIYNQSNVNIVLNFKDGSHVHIVRYGEGVADSKYRSEVAAHQAQGVRITFSEVAVEKPSTPETPKSTKSDKGTGKGEGQRRQRIIEEEK